jgi:hypothetical protein
MGTPTASDVLVACLAADGIDKSTRSSFQEDLGEEVVNGFESSKRRTAI